MKGSALKKLLALLVAVLLLLTAAGCGRGSGKYSPDDDNSLQRVLDAGELVLGLDTEFPPMGFVDESGEITGFDIDVAQEVCDRLGVTLVKRGIVWDEKENDLSSRRIDCIWNGLSVTPGREKIMNLSDPYMKNELIVVVPGDSKIKSLRDLSGKKVGVQSGSTAQEVLDDPVEYPDVSIKPFDNVMRLLDSLEQKKVDAALLDSVAAYYSIFSKDEKYYILSDSLGEEEYAVGFRKNDHKLRDKVQEIISSIKADGTLGEISKKWFGSDITIVK